MRKPKDDGYYHFPESEVALSSILHTFDRLVSEFGFEIVSTERVEYFSRVVYQNPALERRVEICNATNYTDYGFSIFIYNMADENDYHIAATIPYETQDEQCRFVADAAVAFFDDEGRFHLKSNRSTDLSAG